MDSTPNDLSWENWKKYLNLPDTNNQTILPGNEYKTHEVLNNFSNPQIQEFEAWQSFVYQWRIELDEKKSRQGVFLVLISQIGDQTTFLEIQNGTVIIKYRYAEDFYNQTNGEPHRYESRERTVGRLLSILQNRSDIRLWLRGYDLPDRRQNYNIWQGTGENFKRRSELTTYRLHCVLDAYFSLKSFLDQLDYL